MITKQKTIRPIEQPTLVNNFGYSEEIASESGPTSPLSVLQPSSSNACAQLAIGIALVTNLAGDATIPQSGQPTNTVYTQLHSVIDPKEIEQTSSPLLHYSYPTRVSKVENSDEILVPRMVVELPVTVRVSIVDAPAFSPIEDD